MDLNVLRMQIDEIDREIVSLFCKRMAVSAQIADYKKQNGLAIHVPEREAQKLESVSSLADEGMEAYTRELFEKLFELSKDHQNKCNV